MNGSRWRHHCGDAIQKKFAIARGRSPAREVRVLPGMDTGNLTPAAASDIRLGFELRTYANSNRINSISNAGYRGLLLGGPARCAAHGSFPESRRSQ